MLVQSIGINWCDLPGLLQVVPCYNVVNGEQKYYKVISGEYKGKIILSDNYEEVRSVKKVMCKHKHGSGLTYNKIYDVYGYINGQYFIINDMGQPLWYSIDFFTDKHNNIISAKEARNIVSHKYTFDALNIRIKIAALEGKNYISIPMSPYSNLYNQIDDTIVDELDSLGYEINMSRGNFTISW